MKPCGEQNLTQYHILLAISFIEAAKGAQLGLVNQLGLRKAREVADNQTD